MKSTILAAALAIVSICAHAEAPGYPWNCETSTFCIKQHEENYARYMACAGCQATMAKAAEQQKLDASMRVDRSACAKDSTCRQNDTVTPYRWDGQEWVIGGATKHVTQ